MRFWKSAFVLVLTAIVFAGKVLADESVSTNKSVPWTPRFARPGFSTVDDFVEAVRLRNEPWGDLLVPDEIPEDRQRESFRDPPLSEVTIIRRSRESAIVFAKNKPLHKSPYCAAVFLLSKTGRRLHVTDFIRKAIGYESYSDLEPPKVLSFHPRTLVHFHLTEICGGRKWAFQREDFYVVRHGKFHRTLQLENVGALLSPAAPYREFSQGVKVGVFRGRPSITVDRTWGMGWGNEGSEKRQTLTVNFSWDSRRQRFTNPKVKEITLKVPPSWSGDGLPLPPD